MEITLGTSQNKMNRPDPDHSLLLWICLLVLSSLANLAKTRRFSLQHKIQIVIRVLLGGLFAFSGIAFFLMTPPEIPPGDLATFMAGMMASKYFFPLLKVTEIVCGLLLISGFFVPLALVVLAPIVINIFFVHLMMTPIETLVTPVLIGIAMIYLSFFSPSYSPAIKRLFMK